MEESCEIRYESGKKRIYIFGALAVLSILGLMLSSAVAVFIFFLICGVSGVIMARQNYKQLLLFEDRMQLADISGNMQWEIYFSDIRHCGFLDAVETYNSDIDGDSLSNGVDSELLIILLHDNRSAQLDGNEFEEIHAVYSFIRKKADLQ